MKRPRFSIAGLLIFVAAVAVGLAALSHPSCLSASLTFSLLVMSLAIAFLGALYRRGPKRAFWVGFLTCGGLYLMLSQIPWFESHVSHRLITTAILDFVYPQVPSLPNTANAVTDPWKLWTGMPPDYSDAHPRLGFTTSSTDEDHKRRAQFYVNTSDEFLGIGHSLFSMLFGLAGGLLARHFRAESEATRPSQ